MRSGIVVALPLTAVSSQFVIGSFEARFFARAWVGAMGDNYVPVSRDAQRSALRRPSAPLRQAFASQLTSELSGTLSD